MSEVTKAIIITSYLENDFNMKNAVTDGDYVICTDGGYDIALEEGITPNILIGDLDSINSKIPEHLPVLRFNPVKDYTDLQLSLDHAVSKGADTVEIWGGIGGRLDQTVANLQLLSRYSKEFSSLLLRDGANEAKVLSPDRETYITPREGWYFSLFSLSGESTGVTIRNAAYELEGSTLTSDFPLGVSNEFTKNKNAVISYESGTLLLILSRK